MQKFFFLIIVLLVGAYCYYEVQVPKNIIRSIVTSTLKMLSESQMNLNRLNRIHSPTIWLNGS